MQYSVIDFHTHPFIETKDNICIHKECFPMDLDNTRTLMQSLGVEHICGSVISTLPLQNGESIWDRLQENNRTALLLKEKYQDFYSVGFHIHPDYKQQSLDEIEKMSALGVKILGELVPYIHAYSGYTHKHFDEIIECATAKNLIVSLHSMGEDEMDILVKRHPNTTFVMAHPGEYKFFCRHLARAKLSENYYVDVSGTGMFRHGMLRHLIDGIGVEHVLFGSDYPVCNVAMNIGGVTLDTLLTEHEKQQILYGNAKRLLQL